MNTKTRLLKKMAEHVLETGLNRASLRPLAHAAGTSDRMLIYHFGSKEQLVAALLDFLSIELMKKLEEEMRGSESRSNLEIVLEIVALLRKESFQPYTRVWLDIISSAAHGDANHRKTGQQVMSGYMNWLIARLAKDEPNRRGSASLLLTLIEGTIIMDSVGHSEIANAAIEGALS